MYRSAICVSPLVTAILAPAAMAQSNSPAFEVTSVKLHPLYPGTSAFRVTQRADDVGFKINGNRVTERTASVRDLMQDAYHVKGYQIIGLPEWASRGEVVFDIDGRTVESPSNDDVRLMLQALLVERFQLKLHRDTRELPVYELRAAKGGAKLKPVARPNSAAVPSGAGGGTPPMLTAGIATSTIPMLLSLLNQVTDRTVLDRTNLDIEGSYEYKNLDWRQLSRNLRGGDGDPGVSVFTEVQEKLGLRLEPAKGATDVLVVDHVERPSAN